MMVEDQHNMSIINGSTSTAEDFSSATSPTYALGLSQKAFLP